MTLLTASAFVSIIALNFTQMKHPLAMGFTLLIQTLLICFTASLSTKSVWFSYILFLIFLGAMLVLFVYVATLASNEPFHISPVMLFTSSLIMAFVMTILFFDPLIIPFKQSYVTSFLDSNSIYSSSSVILKSIYTSCWADLTAFIILYLLLTLIVVVDITTKSFAPMRYTQ